MSKNREYLQTLANATFTVWPDFILDKMTQNARDGMQSAIRSGHLFKELGDQLLHEIYDQFDPEKFAFPPDLERRRVAAVELVKNDYPELKTIPVAMLKVPGLTGFSFEAGSKGRSIGLSASFWMPMRVVLQCIKGIYAHGTELSNGNHHSKEAYFSNLADHVSYMKGEFDLLVHVEDAPESILDITGPSAKPDKHIVDAMQRIHLFAILHEFGHIALKHAASEDVVDQIAACYDGVEINASKMQEFKADEFAGNYIWDNSETGFLPNVATVSAITQFFFILQFTNPSSINQSAELHPTPLERLVNILSYWNSIDRTGQFPKIYESATYFAHVCHAIMNRLVEVGVCEDPTGM